VQCKPLVLRWSCCYLPPQPEGETWPDARRDGSRNCPLERGTAMSARAATATQATQKAQRELEDLQLVVRTRNGDTGALDVLIRRYTGFVRLKASSYFLAGGEGRALVKEA